LLVEPSRILVFLKTYDPKSVEATQRRKAATNAAISLPAQTQKAAGRVLVLCKLYGFLVSGARFI
jgi:hypothetical protein